MTVVSQVCGTIPPDDRAPSEGVHLTRTVKLATLAVVLGAGSYFIGAATGAPSPAVNSGLSLPEDGEAFQAEILSDGVVTLDEYEAATRASIACIEAVGLEVVGPATFDDVRQSFVYEIRLTESAKEDVDEAEAAYEKCHREYERDVAIAWAQSADTSDFEAEVDRATQQCLAKTDLGTDLQDLFAKEASGELSREDSEVLAMCRSTAVLETLNAGSADG